MRRKSASEHNFQGVGCNLRVLQAIFPGGRKSKVFQGLPGFPGFVGHPESVVNWPHTIGHIHLQGELGI